MNILFCLIIYFIISVLNLVNIRYIYIFKIVLCNLCFSLMIIIDMLIFFINNLF